MIPLYPSLEAATESGPGSAAITPELLWALVDALADGVALTGDDGRLALVNRRVEDMFGYQRRADRPAGRVPHPGRSASGPPWPPGPVHASAAVPADGRRGAAGGAAQRRDHLPGPDQPQPGPHCDRPLHPDRDTRRHPDPAAPRLGELDRAAAAPARAHRSQELLARVASHLLQVGLSLQAASSQPGDVARQRIAEAVHRLDDTIHEIRDHVFAARHRLTPG